MSPWLRTYCSIWTANLITAAGMTSFLPFFAEHLRELGVAEPAVAAWTGAVFGAAPLTAALLGPFWGRLGDRFGHRPMVLRALLAIALFVGAMAFAQSALQLLLLRIGQGLFSGFVAPSQVLVSIGAPRERVGLISGGMQSALAGGSVLGPAAGAALGLAVGIRNVYLFVSVGALLSALLVALLAREGQAERRADLALRPGALLAATFRDLARFLRLPRLREALVLLLLVHLGLGAVVPLLQLTVESLGAIGQVEALQGTGWLFSAMALVLMVVNPVWGRVGDRAGHSRMIRLGTFTTGLGLVACAFAPTYGWFLAGMLFVALASAGTGPGAWAVAAAEAEDAERGSAFGVVFSTRAFARALGGACGGLLTGLLGLRGLFVAAGLMVALLLLALPRPERAATEPPP